MNTVDYNGLYPTEHKDCRFLTTKISQENGVIFEGRTITWCHKRVQRFRGEQDNYDLVDPKMLVSMDHKLAKL